METIATITRYLIAALVIITIGSCRNKVSKTETETLPVAETATKGPIVSYPKMLEPPPLSEFIRRIFQDSRGNYWFGTNGDGLVRYNGTRVDFYKIDQGFNGYAVRGIAEDKNGIIWVGSDLGLTKVTLDPSNPRATPSFTNYNSNDGLIGNNTWSLYIDSKDHIWVGTLEGVSVFDGQTFTPFKLPETPKDPLRGVSSTKVIHSIMEDSKGKMWFASNSGAFIYDGTTLSNLSKKDGLADTNVNDLLEDNDGSIWFATHHKGLSRYDGNSFINYTENGTLDGIEIWSLFKDSKGHIWFPVENVGVYRYDGEDFKLYTETNGLNSLAIQTIYEDANGVIWLGGYKGLSRFDGERFTNIVATGPW